MKKAVLFCWIVLGLSSFMMTAVQAEAIAKVEKVKLDEKMTNVQLVVKGSPSDEFEVDLKMPDGTQYTGEQYDGKKVLYLGVEQGVTWLINEAPAGEYELTIKGPDQSYTVMIQPALRRPVTTWLAPKEQQLDLVAGQSLHMSWQTEGDYDHTDNIFFLIQPENGGQTMRIGKASLQQKETTLSIPDGLVDGTYTLLIAADNKTPDGQTIDPKVQLRLNRGIKLDGLEVTSVKPLGDSVIIELKVPKQVDWMMVSGTLTTVQGKPAKIQAYREDIAPLAEKKEEGFDYFKIHIPLRETGQYQGSLQLMLDEHIATPPVNVPSFELTVRDWSKDTVKWVIESEKTNVQLLPVIVNVQKETQVQVMDGFNMVLDEQIGADQINQDVQLHVPMVEGDHIIEVFLGDPGGDVHSVSKRYLVDYSPPRLEMIQPQSEHKALPGNYASGMIDTDSVVIYKGQEIKPDSKGYFQITNVGSNLGLTVRDSHGNETMYQWSKEGSWNKALLVFGTINGLLIIGTAITVFFIRRKRTY